MTPFRHFLNQKNGRQGRMLFHHIDQVFEIRTYRLCQRILMFHHFPDKLEINDYLVRSTEFSYDESPLLRLSTKSHSRGSTVKVMEHT